MDFAIEDLLHSSAFPHRVNKPLLLETHISWVVLTGDFAYKIKKPVNFGFVDFSSLEKRQQCCRQEVILNSRLAAEIYLGVVAISTVDGALRIVDEDEAEAEALEYAVKMRQFDTSAQLDQMLEQGRLDFSHMRALANLVSGFHQAIPCADDTIDYGNPTAIHQPVRDNFSLLSEQPGMEKYQQRLNHLAEWSEACFNRLERSLLERKDQGYVRQCHGDMHCGNIVWYKHADGTQGPLAFDCIEFNDSLSWIDLISEVAFLVMDLEHRQQASLANHFLNAYMEQTGDYAGIKVLDYYLCYRAMVRAKVTALSAESMHGLGGDACRAEEFESYLSLAESYTRRKKLHLIIMHGLSASGKSTLSEQLLNQSGAIRLRSDVERKRLFGIEPGLAASKSSGEQPGTGIYSVEASARTYDYLRHLATLVLHAGRTVIVDAAFLKFAERDRFHQLAKKLDVPFSIVHATATNDELRRRIVARQDDVSDADLAVLEQQFEAVQPLKQDELAHTYQVDSAAGLSPGVCREITGISSS